MENHHAINNLILVFLSLATVAGCSDDLSLQATFEKQMKADGADGFNIIHIDDSIRVWYGVADDKNAKAVGDKQRWQGNYPELAGLHSNE